MNLSQRSIITVLFLSLTSFFYAQEGLEPLYYNQELIQQIGLDERSIDQLYIYEIDTIHIPFKDDFSADLFKKFEATPNAPNVTDTVFYAALNGALPLPDTIAFSTDTTYRFNVTLVPPNDSVVRDTIALPSTMITVCDINTFPVNCSTITVWPGYNEIDSVATPINPDITAFLSNPEVIQDSAQVFFVGATDTLSLWQDQFAFRNDHYGVNPPTIGVATLDGLNAEGYPYDFSSSTASGLADKLTSKPLYLGTDKFGNPLAPIDSIYMSFYYQPQGNGNTPEFEDSLVLEFWAPDSNDWYSIWKDTGSATKAFQQVMIPIKDPKFIKNGFKFRFKNYGSIAGSFDHWHIDYVRLSANRTINDTIESDVAFQDPLFSSLNEYSAIPWTHYKWDPDFFTKDSIVVNQRNNDVVGRLVSNNEISVLYNNGIVHTIVNPNTPSIGGRTDFITDFPFNVDPYIYDTTVTDTCPSFQVQITHRTTPDQCRTNDTLRLNQHFNDFYAYDDGTAEAAYGVQGASAKIAVQFDILQPDSLKSVFMHFSPSAFDVSGDPFFLTVWDDQAGVPGNIIFQNAATSRPQYNIGENGFYEYILEETTLVSGRYYVGWQQTTSDRLNIGFDRNTVNNQRTYYNLGSWIQSGQAGTIMVRPAFVSDKDNLVGLYEEVSEEVSFKLFPNPFDQYIYIDNNGKPLNHQLNIFDLNGRKLASFTLNSDLINMESYDSGMYLLEFIDITTKARTFKKVLKN